MIEITIKTEDSENYERFLQTLPSSRVKIFGVEWSIAKAYLAAPYEVSLDLFNNSIPIKMEVVKKP